MDRKSLSLIFILAIIASTYATVCGCEYPSGDKYAQCEIVCEDKTVNDYYYGTHYENSPYVGQGSLAVQDCIKAYGKLVLSNAQTSGIPNALKQIFQLVMQESSCNAEAVGNNGLPKGQSASWGCGLMQIESVHAGEYNSINWPSSRDYDTSSSSCFYPPNNVMMGVAIYSRYTAAMGGDPVQGMCAYNRGITGARNFGASACAAMVQATYLRHQVPETDEVLRQIQQGS